MKVKLSESGLARIYRTRQMLGLLAVLMIAASGCRTIQQQPIQQSKTTIKEIVRDSTVIIPGDQSSFQAILGKDDAGKPVIKEVLTVQAGKRTKVPRVQINNQVLKVDCLCDSMSIYLKLKDTHITDMLKETVFVPTEKPLTAWQQVQLWLGRVLLIAITGGIIMLIITRKIA